MASTARSLSSQARSSERATRRFSGSTGHPAANAGPADDGYVLEYRNLDAGGRIGAKAAASAHPDGHTLLLGGTNVNAMLGALYKNLGFDPTDSFAPVA